MSGPVTGADVDVLVVGAGPTGLLAGCELYRRGVAVRIVDQAPHPADAPRALSLWPRALDILEDLGVGERVRRASVPVNASEYFSDRQHVATLRFPPDLAARNLPQYETERLLTERLNALGGKVERGVRLLAIDDLDRSGRIEASSGVTAVLEHGDGGVERVRVPFVVGADGAGSAVRAQLGIGFHGSTYEMAFALLDTKVDGDLPPDVVQYYQAPTGTLVIVPMPGGVFRILSVLPAGTGEVTAAMMQTLLDERGPGGVRITEPVWRTAFRVHARHATGYQLGRVFLAGDAAHVHSPAGGQGMNYGLQDAHNLAWRLAAVVRGDGPSSLLAEYGRERSEAVRRVVRSTDQQTRVWMVRGAARVRARDAALRLLDRTGALSRLYAPVLAGRRMVYSPVRASQLPTGWCRLRRRSRVGTVLPRELALSLGAAGPRADPHAWTLAVLVPSRSWLREVAAMTHDRVRLVHLPSADAGSALGCRRPGYYLVRPDGHLSAHGHEHDLHRLRAELDTALTVGDPR